jgi:hypothetical protein
MNGQLSFKKPNSTIDALNQSTFTKNDLNSKSYIAYADFIKNGLINKIQKELKEKFNESSHVDFSNLKPSDILAYSFLLKTLTFTKKFENLDTYFLQNNVQAFGIKKVNNDIDHKLKNQVYINYYANDNDFALCLKPQGSDIIGLIKTPKSFKSIHEMILATPKTTSEYRLKTDESIIIPKLEFNLEHHFKELINQHIYINKQISDYFISDAVQFIKFLLNEEGAKLRSEAAIVCRKCISHNTNRQFIFDKPFLIYLKEEQSNIPYFAIWVTNSEFMKTKSGK